MVELTRVQITARIKVVNEKLTKLDDNFVHDKVTFKEYQKQRKHLVLKKLFPLQRAALILLNPKIYGYDKKKVTLAKAKELDKKFPGGTPIPAKEFERYYGFKYTPRRKK